MLKTYNTVYDLYFDTSFNSTMMSPLISFLQFSADDMEHINKRPYNNINGNNYTATAAAAAAAADNKAPYVVVVQYNDHIDINSATTDRTTYTVANEASFTITRKPYDTINKLNVNAHNNAYGALTDARPSNAYNPNSLFDTSSDIVTIKKYDVFYKLKVNVTSCADNNIITNTTFVADDAVSSIERTTTSFESPFTIIGTESSIVNDTEYSAVFTKTTLLSAVYDDFFFCYHDEDIQYKIQVERRFHQNSLVLPSSILL